MSDELAFLRARYDRLELLYQMARVIHSTLDPQEAIDLILREAIRLTTATSGSVALVNPTRNRLEILASHGLPRTAASVRLRVGEGITGWVAAMGKPARVGDVRADPRYVCLRPEAVSELAVPLQVGDDTRGVLNVDSDVACAFSAGDEELLQELAHQAAAVIHNTWLYEHIRLKARMFETLVSVGRTINSSFSQEEALQAVAREACVLMQAKLCSVHLVDDSMQWLDLKACHGGGHTYRRKRRLSVEESLLGVVIRRKKPLQVENVQQSSGYQNVHIAREENLVSLLSTPLVHGHQAIGTISVYKGAEYTFSNEEIQVLGALAELSATAIEKARLHERTVAVEDQLRQSEKLSALGLLAAEVAHEIRNPLTVLKLLFHSLDLRFPPNDARTKDTQIITRKLEQLNKTVEQILNFARNCEPKFAEVDLNKVLSDLALISRHKLRNSRVKLITKLPRSLPAVWADEMQLEQAFLNLMLNAIQAMPEGGKLVVSTKKVPAARKAKTPGQILVQFRDSGEGMTPQQRRLAMTSILSTSKRGGTGLGLALVKRMVDTHQGSVRIQSARGKGTTISVFLPVHRLA